MNGCKTRRTPHEIAEGVFTESGCYGIIKTVDYV